MTENSSESTNKQTFFFIRGGDTGTSEVHWPDEKNKVRQSITESLNARHVSFLLGAGCSSSVVDNIEVGVPTMTPLAQEFTQPTRLSDTTRTELDGAMFGHRH